METVAGGAVAAEEEAAGKVFLIGASDAYARVAAARLDRPRQQRIAPLTLMLESLPCKLKLPVSARSSDG